ncbi:MAG: cobyric acid synthase [Candidatus Omnitrophota bacterium]|nr:cobyric acid synthase [Candidatus Omnitrophota bacterium]
MTKAIQICGTGSGVGKSIITAALCRIFYQDGYKVAPFKAQNMALNSYVASDGGEIGRAQAEQAYAANIASSVHMNPILLKPTADRRAQVIVQGTSIGNMSAVEYARRKKSLLKKVHQSYETIAQKYKFIVIEGAGSPAEINLKAHDIVNMKMAEYADAGVILVGDIDKGGVFASLVGTLELLDKNERDRIKGFIINKFRGDKRLLQGGLRFLEKRTGKKVLGVIPYYNDIKIGEEDSVSLECRMQNAECGMRKNKKLTKLNISVVHLPHISNFTDFDALEKEHSIKLRYIKTPQELEGADVIIIPGTKNTIGDLTWFKQTELDKKITSSIIHRPLSIVVGICGGFQMLGESIDDPYSIESSAGKIKGLGLLDMTTTLAKNKQTYQIKGKDLLSKTNIYGYEIHHGNTKISDSIKPRFLITNRTGKAVRILDGAISSDKRFWGTYIHGIFDSKEFRKKFILEIMQAKGLTNTKLDCASFNRDKEFNKLADLVRKNIDIKYLYKILNNPGKEPYV